MINNCIVQRSGLSISGKIMRLSALLMALGCVEAFGQVLYVSPGAMAAGDGNATNPMAFAAAINRADKDMAISEIILAGGEYFADGVTLGASFITSKDTDPAKIGSLTIHPARDEKAILQNSIRIEDAEVVPGSPGLYRSKKLPPGLANMWERDTRRRYIDLATRASVAGYPCSAFADHDEKWLYLHTSDGKPPKEHQVFLSPSAPNGRIFGVYRPNTTIEGLTFRDYVGNGQAFVMNGPDITARRCLFENSNIGIAVGGLGKNYLVEDCTFRDVAQGIRSGATNLIVRRCRIEKARDAFMIPIYPSTDTGIYCYYPAGSATVTDTLISGYYQGIRVKTGGPATGPFIFRHNTIVHCGDGDGICWVNTWPGSDASYNIIVQAKNFINVWTFDPTFTLDCNLFWTATQQEEWTRREALIRGANRGKFNLIADPRFVDPANGDYRLLPDSPALFLKDAEGRQAGAFGVAAPDTAAKIRPALELDFEADTVPFGGFGVLTFERDPWIGGGITRVRDLSVSGGPARRLTGEVKANVSLRAFDKLGRIVKTRMTIGDQPPQEVPYTPRQAVQLPDKDGEHLVRFEVQNDRGLWSESADVLLRLDRAPPTLVGKPEVIAGNNGLIVTFRTSKPCQAEVQFGPTDSYGRSVKSPDLVKRNWSSQDGGDWIETWTIPRTEFAVAIIKPEVESGQTVHLRIVVTDEAGLKSEGKDFTARVIGKNRSIFVSTAGKDEPARGAKDAPLRTIQYAADQALPGDRVLLMPGLYTNNAVITHGGLNDDVRLTIEAETPGTVTFDTAKREYSVLQLENSGFVTIRGIRFLFYKRAGVYAYRSPHVTVEQCTFYNGPTGPGYHAFFAWSPYGTVTRCLAIGSETGLVFLKSPNATVTHNTISQMLYCAAGYDYSLAGTVQMNNAFTFAGNDQFTGCYQHPDEMKTFRSDYNNLGTSLINHNTIGRKPDDPILPRIKAQEFKFDYGRGFSSGSKRIVNIDKAYCLMEDWRSAYGQDKHSIFADSKFVRPVASVDGWDWRVKPDSPNIGAGENGTTIGAFEAAK